MRYPQVTQRITRVGEDDVARRGSSGHSEAERSENFQEMHIAAHDVSSCNTKMGVSYNAMDVRPKKRPLPANGGTG